MVDADVEGSQGYGDSNKQGIDPQTLQETDEERNRTRTWEAFSNHEASQRKSVISIEAWHNGIHMLIGTGHGGAIGHMAKAEVAAVSFSPHSFELSVDILGTPCLGCIIGLSNLRYVRSTAAKQALYPDKYVAEKGNVNIDSELYPFFKSWKSFYTSNDLRDKKAGFDMPGSADLDDESRGIIKKKCVTTTIGTIYP